MDLDLRESIRKQGWQVMLIGDDSPAPYFAYTIGLFESFGHPEVVIYGLPHGVMLSVLNWIGRLVREGDRFAGGTRSALILERGECAFVEVDPAAFSYVMRIAEDYYGRRVPALHCIWSDREGRFPWDPDATPEFRRLQPALSVTSGYPTTTAEP
jgi:hypothetical protein